MTKKTYRAPRGFVRPGAEVYIRIGPGYMVKHTSGWHFHEAVVEAVHAGLVTVRYRPTPMATQQIWSIPRRDVLCPAADAAEWRRSKRRSKGKG